MKNTFRDWTLSGAVLAAPLARRSLAAAPARPESQDDFLHRGRNQSGHRRCCSRVPQDQIAHLQIAPVEKSSPPASVAAHRLGGLQRLHHHAGLLRRRRPGARDPGHSRRDSCAPARRSSPSTVRTIRRPAPPISKPKTPSRSPTKTTSARRISSRTKPSPKRDVQQAESDRSQAQSDVESSDRRSARPGHNRSRSHSRKVRGKPLCRFRCSLPSAAKSSSAWWAQANCCRPARRNASPSPTPARSGFWSTSIRAIWAACTSGDTVDITTDCLSRNVSRDEFPTSPRRSIPPRALCRRASSPKTPATSLRRTCTSPPPSAREPSPMRCWFPTPPCCATPRISPSSTFRPRTNNSRAAW